MKDILSNLSASVVMAMVATFILHTADVFPNQVTVKSIDIPVVSAEPPPNPRTPPEEKIFICDQIAECLKLAEVGYYEARSESDVGVLAVLNVVMNRVEKKRWPSTIEEVVEQRRQFSYTEDGSRDQGYTEKEQLDRMKILSYNVLHGIAENPIGDSDHYHHTRIHKGWSSSMEVVAVIGNHIFFNEG